MTVDMKDFLATQMKLLLERDTGGIAARYAHDATFLRFDRIDHGQAGVKELFDDYLDEDPRVIELEDVVHTDDMLIYQTRMWWKGHLTRAVGTVVLKDGEIWRQTCVFIPIEGEGAGGSEGGDDAT